MIDLYKGLPEIEKTRLTNYINRWGVREGFIGIDKWLEDWSHANQKLYKLLGNQFVYTQDITYERNKNELKKDIENIDSDFPSLWRDFINFLYHYDEYKTLKEEKKRMYFWTKEGTYFKNNNTQFLFHSFLYAETLVEGVVMPLDTVIKERKDGAAREYRMQGGCKIFRAITQTLKYYKDELEEFRKIWNKEAEIAGNKGVDDIFAELEKYRVQYSIVTNNRRITGKLHISINPIDYLTMSDNASKWSSCMSWTDAGCYRVGTIEMMNSNNVLCCYMTKGKDKGYDFFYRDPFYINEDEEEDSKDRNIEEWTCPDKKWRQLFYITKDIIVNGKPYPFANPDISKIVLKIIKDLAKKNLNWEYDFGPERYLDMKYLHSDYAMERAKSYRKYSPRKKNIIFDSKGMYNDMIADKNTEYWCYRNKVDKPKIISYSGKAKCLCCKKPIIHLNLDLEYDDGDFDSYHDKYLNCDNVICEDCASTKYTCDACESITTLDKFVDVAGCHLCESCYEDKVKICPGCGKPFLIPYFDDIYCFKRFDTAIEDLSIGDYEYVSLSNLDQAKLVPFYCCKQCLVKMEEKIGFEDWRPKTYAFLRAKHVSKKGYDFGDPKIAKYFLWNLKRYIKE